MIHKILKFSPLLRFTTANMQTSHHMVKNLLVLNHFIHIHQKRFNHFKFKPGMLKKQKSILNRFSYEIEDTMNKIVKNQKVNQKRSKLVLRQTTSHLLNKNQEKFESLPDINISSGSPEQLLLRAERLGKTFLTTRMKIMNSNYSRAIAQIFIADYELSKMLDELGVKITQVCFNFK